MSDHAERVRWVDMQTALVLGEVRAWDEVDCEPYEDDDGPGLDWDDGPEPPPGRRVKTIETTGERL